MKKSSDLITRFLLDFRGQSLIHQESSNFCYFSSIYDSTTNNDCAPDNNIFNFAEPLLSNESLFTPDKSFVRITREMPVTRQFHFDPDEVAVIQGGYQTAPSSPILNNATTCKSKRTPLSREKVFVLVQDKFQEEMQETEYLNGDIDHKVYDKSLAA